jgi:hypothetical protein
MEKNRQGYLVSSTHRECTKCGEIFKITSKMTLCKTCNSTRVKSNRPEWRMHQRAKQRAKAKGLEFTISPEDVVIPDRCPILDIPLVTHSGKSGAYRDSPSLDRKDNSKGYTPDNIWVVSQLANAMKCHASEQDLQKFAQWVLSPGREVAHPVEHTESD